MTYSPLLPTTQGNCASFGLSSDTLLSRLGCLLHCPSDTPNLWPQVLSVLCEELHCDNAQLFLSGLYRASGNAQHFSSDGSADGSANGSADGGVAKPAVALPVNVNQLLRQYLGIAAPREVNILWQSQATDLQAQLTSLVSGGFFHLSGTQTYLEDCWPAQLSDIFGSSQGRHLLLLPLVVSDLSQADQASQAAQASQSSQVSFESPHTEMEAAHIDHRSVPEPAFVGVLVLFRQAAQGGWLAEDVALLEAAGSQIYLAIRRSRLDQIAQYRSACDQLTELPDRVLFTQQMVRAIAAAAEQDTMLGVAFLDLDRFKNINDTLGHEAGDCLLQQVAERLKSCLRGYDVVARWGGDEFTLLLCALRSSEDISNILERILQRLSAPFYIQGEELYVTASLGIALAPYDGEDEQTLLRNADAAMYQAKAQGRNNYQVYFEEINADARTQLNLETDLRKAIDNNELFLCYQPQVDLLSGQWIGLEALIRWQHPSLGLISPAKFIPIAEDTGLIEPIGRWVLQKACTQYRQWRQMGFPQLRLAVNLSAHQFHRSHLVRSIMQILKNTDFDPHYLELEVTESAAMHDVDYAIEVLKKLSHTGIQIAMDDFGTGYSSLSVLKRFPLDTIKIDRSFVMDLVDSPSDAAIASTIIALAKGLNFKVLAEGIETPEQIAVLSKMGCDYAQGYWYSKPLTVEQIDGLLTQGTLQNR
ncbi:MAG: EAL domain-containing protein [Phormidesmis sp. RL_2_1]|nr:EAL domain-containing protein [Phormidesmis sp. RL_2_1]